MKDGPLTLLLDHVEICNHCDWRTRTFCRTADLLLANGAQRAAALLLPIPTIPRAKAKA